MNIINNPLLPKDTIKQKQKIKKTLILKSSMLFLLGALLFVSAGMIRGTDTYSPVQKYKINERDFSSKENINTMEGAFQSGVVEYDYEKVSALVTYQPCDILFVGGTQVKEWESNILTDAQFLTTEKYTKAWLESNVKSFLKDSSDIKLCVVIADPNCYENIDEYITILNSWPELFPDVSFTFVNLVPANCLYSEDMTNQDIVEFNKNIKLKLNSEWRFVDLYDHVAHLILESEKDINSYELKASIFSWILSQVDTEEQIQYIPKIPETTENTTN